MTQQVASAFNSGPDGVAQYEAGAEAFPTRARLRPLRNWKPANAPLTMKKNIGRVDLDELWRGRCAYFGLLRATGRSEDLQRELGRTPSPDTAPGDRRALALAGDLVDLVNVDDAGLGLLDVIVGGPDGLSRMFSTSSPT